MIESREQRKATTLLQRRKIAIIVSLVLVTVLTLSFFLVYNYFKTVLPFVDYDGTKYQITKVDGVYKMYTKNGAPVDTVTPPGSDKFYYVTAAGTQLQIDAATGGYEIKAIPDLYYQEYGENLDADLLISIFKTVATKDILTIEIKNQVDHYTIMRVPGDSDLSFKLKGSLVSVLDSDLLSYLTYIVGDPTVSSRIDDPIKDANGEYSEYGLAPQTRIDADGNEYQYTPSYYVLTTLDDVKHKIIIGDRLISGEGYYVQYENTNGNKSPAVYVYSPPNMESINQTSFENTVLAAAKDIIVPNIAYFGTTNNYYEVENFAINQRVEGKLEELIKFSYIDAADRTGSVQTIHPYVFTGESLIGYHPNYDNISAMFNKLLEPDIVSVAALTPTNDDKVEYGIMQKITAEDGSEKYEYIPEYTLEFDRTITLSYTDDNGAEISSNEKVHQTVYISKQNEDGNYYVFTELRFLETADDSKKKGIALDTICEVSGETLKFLVYDKYNWIYPSFMQIKIDYLSAMEIISPDYSASFKITNSKLGDVSIMEVEATDSTGATVKTFGGMTFTDIDGYHWIVTPSQVKMYSPDGKTEVKPSTRKYEHNALGDQVQVNTPAGTDVHRTAANGDHIYIEKDYIKIKRADGSGTQTYLRYQNTLFKYLFSIVTNTSIVDSYDISAEDEQTLLGDPSKHQLTVKVTDNTGVTSTYNFYSLTARKSYLTIGDETEVGGFYVQATRLTKILSDTKKFFAGEIIDKDAHK